MGFKLEYCVSETYNVGDDLNAWLWPKFFGELISQDSTTYFLGIGTILTEKRINKRLASAEEVIIFSSGAWEWNVPKLNDNCLVYGVRGPRTAKKLGLGLDLVVGDGAYLIREVAIPKPKSIRQKGKVGFVPHHRSEDYLDWEAVCEAVGLTFITAKQPVEDFLMAIQECELVVTEAMHGAIIADALRIPWKGVRFSPEFDDEKWYDFAESMDVNLILRDLPFISTKSMSVGKLVENGSKKLLAKLLPFLPKKWSSLVAVYRIASEQDIEHLKQVLGQLSKSAEYQLSTEEKVSEITIKLKMGLERLMSEQD